jgi:hypothetical protein
MHDVTRGSVIQDSQSNMEENYTSTILYSTYSYNVPQIQNKIS